MRNAPPHGQASLGWLALLNCFSLCVLGLALLQRDTAAAPAPGILPSLPSPLWCSSPLLKDFERLGRLVKVLLSFLGKLIIDERFRLRL